MRNLQFKSIDLSKYTELTIDKQPTEKEIQLIVQAYANALHPTHIAIAVPLDSNAEFLAQKHVPSPLTIDEFTRVWINAIHKAGTNVYFKGTFCGIKNLYDFGFDKTTPIGTADKAITEGKSTWMGRIYNWLQIHRASMSSGDMIGIIPEITDNAFNGNFFLPAGKMPGDPNEQTNFLNFYVELKKLCDSITTGIEPIYTGFSSNVYKDIVNSWIPTLLFDLTGTMPIEYYGSEQTPRELEKDLNDLYIELRRPIFLSKWQVPTQAFTTTTTTQDNTPQEFFEALGRLREKGILIGVNYFDGINFDEGIFGDAGLNPQGQLISDFYTQGGVTELIEKKEVGTEVDQPKKIQVKEKPTPNITQEHQTTSKEVTEGILEPITKITQPKLKKKTHLTVRQNFFTKNNYKLKTADIPLLVSLTTYTATGAILIIFTSLLLGIEVNNLTIYGMILYTIVVAVGHAIFDGK